MPSHLWGDEDFDWKALGDAEEYLNKNCRRYARLGIWTKEKYGTLRVSTTGAYFTHWPIHNLINPGHVSYRWPRWVMLYIDIPLGKFLESVHISKLIRCYQNRVLRYFWLRAADNWSHIREEILDEYDFYFGEDK